MWWPKVLTYGNWGGPGWSGGVFNHDPEKTDWSVEPVDEMDRLFREHDRGYQAGRDRVEVDRELVQALKEVKVRGFWSNLYRLGAITIFSLKSGGRKNA